MRKSVDQEIVKTLKRRQAALIENCDEDDIIFCSFVRFDMAMSLIGYPFEPKPWMTEEHTKKLLTNLEYQSGIYDLIMKQLFKDAIQKVRKKNK